MTLASSIVTMCSFKCKNIGNTYDITKALKSLSGKILSSQKSRQSPLVPILLVKVPRVGQEKLIMFPTQLAVGDVNILSQSVEEADYVKPE